MNRTGSYILITLLAGPAALAGSPPHWQREQASPVQRSNGADVNRNRDGRDEGRRDKGGDWKRRGDPQHDGQRANSVPPPQDAVRSRLPVTRELGPDAAGRGQRDNSVDRDRGDRRYARDPRPATGWDREKRTWDRDRHGDHDDHRDGDRGRGNRDWDRHHNGDQNYWRDGRGHHWHHERGWYDRYRADHFRYYSGRYFGRSRFFIGYYNAPWGYATRLWVRGDQLPFAYYDGRYYIDDYWRFDLYDPPFGCRWVRVRGNALLIDIETGDVLDAVYDLFW